ncbi:MAG: DUF3800 domain-containing protein [Anaerolineae bacterium]
MIPYIHVYADESRLKEERYMLIGGLWVPAPAEAALRADIAKLRAESRLTAEFKWTKVSRAKLSAYQDLVGTFLKHCDAAFHCIVIDVTLLDYSTFSRGDAELGFYKFYFQLISRKLLSGYHYLVFTDARRNRRAYRLDVLKICTNRWWAKQQGIPEAAPVRAVEARNSKEEDLIQLADVLLGAVGYVWNGHAESPAKVDLIGHIEQSLGGVSLGKGTPRSSCKFNIWHWQPSATSLARQQKKRPGP